MNTIGTFIIVKNESEFIGYSIMSVLDHVDEMVFADGNSTDGTLEIIDYIKKKYDTKNKIKLFLDKDCKNLQQDYVDLFNWTLKQVKSEYAWFLHPDMVCLNPETIRPSLLSNGIRYNVKMISIAGENRELLVTDGRGGTWASIYKNDFGLHYHGFYGAFDEDCYFRDITGNTHWMYCVHPNLPYRITPTEISLVHYCDTKSYERRLGRMMACAKNALPEHTEEKIREISLSHPRVSLKDGLFDGKQFTFAKNDFTPEIFNKYKDEFEPLRKKK